MSDYSPIVLFVYSRLEHTKRTVDNLRKNELAKLSELIVFSDGAKNENDKHEVFEVREYLKNINGFKNVAIIERKVNLGLAKNIQLGVSDVVNKYGKVIVLEDDIVTSPRFLEFMNSSLDYYKDYDKVWHISGWNYPIDTIGLNDTFLWRGMNCWGWATWKDKWDKFEKNPSRLIVEWDKDKISRFNVDGSFPFWKQVESNISGKIDTWAIFWYSTIFEHEGLCLNPTSSLVNNIGLDGSGENCSKSTETLSSFTPLDRALTLGSEKIEENKIALERIKKYGIASSPTLFQRAINRLNKTSFIKRIKR
ncbi:glycosyltransferase [Vibrio cyclitrophicus]